MKYLLIDLIQIIYSADDEDKSTPISGGISFHETLQLQIGSLILTEQEEYHRRVYCGEY